MSSVFIYRGSALSFMERKLTTVALRAGRWRAYAQIGFLAGEEKKEQLCTGVIAHYIMKIELLSFLCRYAEHEVIFNIDAVDHALGRGAVDEV